MTKWKMAAVLHFLLFMLAQQSWSAAAETFSLADIELPNVCPFPYDFDGAKKVCIDGGKVAKVNDEAQCRPEIGLNWNKDSKKCSVIKDKEPKPECSTKIPDLTIKDGNCVVQRETPRSDSGNYVGDCFTIVATPTPNTLGLESGDTVAVTSQRIDGEDRLLSVTRAQKQIIPYFCRYVGPDIKTVRASELHSIGAERSGSVGHMECLLYRSNTIAAIAVSDPAFR